MCTYPTSFIVDREQRERTCTYIDAHKQSGSQATWNAKNNNNEEKRLNAMPTKMLNSMSCSHRGLLGSNKKETEFMRLSHVFWK